MKSWKMTLKETNRKKAKWMQITIKPETLIITSTKINKALIISTKQTS